MPLFEENAAVLARLAREGHDLGPSRPIDFSLVFPDEASAQAFAAKWVGDGLKIKIEEPDRGEEPWDVTVSIEMAPTTEGITSWEQRLDGNALAFGGQADGWGFIQV